MGEFLIGLKRCWHSCGLSMWFIYLCGGWNVRVESWF
jgi:hypothetical protein